MRAYSNSPIMLAQSTYLEHYGVKGQKWGVRRYRNDDGSLTDEGRQHYGINGQRSRSPQVTAQQHSYRVRKFGSKTTGTLEQHPNQLTPEQEKIRKDRAKKILMAAAGVTLAAAVGYSAYRGSTNLRDKMRKEMLNTDNSDWRKISTFNSKYWNSKDRHRYTELTKAHTEYAASHFTRRDAIAAKLKEKTGISINFYKSREQQIADRHEANTYANAIRDIESRGSLNRQISEARQKLKRVKQVAERENASRSRIQEERHGERLRNLQQKQIDEYQKILDDLLEKRRRAG